MTKEGRTMKVDLKKEELVLLIQLLQDHGLKKQQETKQATPFESALLVKLGDAFNERI
jgi:hypothetical protein